MDNNYYHKYNGYSPPCLTLFRRATGEAEGGVSLFMGTTGECRLGAETFGLAVGCIACSSL